MAKKTKRMFMGGMGATPKAGARSAATLPPPSATNAATNAAIGRATGITPPTGGPRVSTPPAATANNQAQQRMMDSLAKAREGTAKMQAQAAGRAPAQQMGSVQRQQLAPGATPPPRGVNPALAGRTNPNPMASRTPAPTQNVARGIGRAMGMGMKKGGSVDGCANKGKTKGRMV